METLMNPTFIEINAISTLLNPKTINAVLVSEVNVEMLILRPYLKKIVFITTELDRIVVYEGDVDFGAHKDDTQGVLIAALLAKIDADYPA